MLAVGIQCGVQLPTLGEQAAVFCAQPGGVRPHVHFQRVVVLRFAAIPVVGTAELELVKRHHQQPLPRILPEPARTQTAVGAVVGRFVAPIIIGAAHIQLHAQVVMPGQRLVFRHTQAVSHAHSIFCAFAAAAERAAIRRRGVVHIVIKRGRKPAAPLPLLLFGNMVQIMLHIILHFRRHLRLALHSFKQLRRFAPLLIFCQHCR